MTTAIKINANDGKTRNVMTGGETEVDFDFPIFAATHLAVYETDTNGDITLLVKDTDYTVPAGSVNQQAGGTIDLDPTQYPSGATAGHVFTVYQNAPQARTTDFTQAGDFFADTLNQELDLLTQQIQQLGRDLARAPLAPVDTTLTSLSLPDPADGFGIVWDGTAGAIRNTTSSLASLEGDAETVAGISADISAVAAIDTEVTTVAGISANVTTVSGISANVTTVAGISANVTTVAGISANVTTVAGIASDITTVAGIAAEVTAAANNIPLSNRTATTDPTVGDDTNDGYSEGSLWVNTTTDTIFLCGDASAGAAVWQSLAGSLSALSDTTISSLSSGNVLTWNGSAWVNDGDIDVTNITAEGSGGGTLKNQGGTACASWGGGSGQNFSITNTLTFGAGGSTVDIVRDEDDMASDDANALATQQSIKAYADTKQEAISGASLSSATVATDDKVLIQDTNDSDNLKTVTAQDIADLASGGALEDVATLTMSGDQSAEADNIFETGYVYIVDFNVSFSSGSGLFFVLRASGSNDNSSNSRYRSIYTSGSGLVNEGGSSGDGEVNFPEGTTPTVDRMSGRIVFYNLADADITRFHGECYYNDSSYLLNMLVGQKDEATAFDGIYFGTNSTPTATGTIKIRRLAL